MLYLKGIAMGGSDVIPGVSGGTVALILGIYEDLLGALGTFTTRPWLELVRRGRLAQAFRRANGTFLVTVAAGIVTAILLLAHPIAWFLVRYPVYVDAAFFGLILASTAVVARRVERWRTAGVLAFVAAALAAFVVVGLTPAATPDGTLFLMLSGALAVCALILPGISGAFILVLLGKYETALAAVASLDFGVLVPLGLGLVIGLVSFVRVMAWLLHRWRAVTMAALTGFMLGSLRKVWPFGPGTASDVAGSLALVIVLVLAGAALVLLLDRAGRTSAS